MPPLKMHFYDGGMKPFRPPELDRDIPMPHEGVLFIGDNGKLITSYYGGNPFAPFGRPPAAGAPRALAGGLLLPASKFKDFQQPPKTLPRRERPDHYTEWTRCCKQGTPTMLPDGLRGIFRSDNTGRAWVRINDDQHQWGLLLHITGDPKQYGRVYVGTHGRGTLYGDPAGRGPRW
jgi:hypothetical protein